jgi:sugar phosphate isomerase/epimerase
MGKLPVGLQLYTVREDMGNDVPGTLKAVADAGYEGVEFAGYFDYSAEDLKAMLDDLGLVCCGAHTPLTGILPEGVQETIDFALALGNKYIVGPGLPSEYTESVEAWQRTAGIFSQTAATLGEAGLRLGYHNHKHELIQKFEGVTGWQTFFDAASDAVFSQLDVGHVLRADEDPVEALNRYPGRFATVHVKDIDESKTDVFTGDGIADWETIFDICESTGGTEWYIVEHEDYPIPPIECAARCLVNIRAMGR